MRRISLLALCLVGLLSLRCLLADPRSTEAGGNFKIDISNPQATTVAAGTFEAKTIAGHYNHKDGRPGTDGGWSILIGSPSLLDNETCKGVGIGFSGKPETSRTWQFAFLGADAGLSDGGTSDGGVPTVAFASNLGSLSYSEGCVGSGNYKTWRSTAGTLTFSAVEEPAELPAGARPGANKTVKFSCSGVQMAGETGTGTFAATCSGEITLFAGYDTDKL